MDIKEQLKDIKTQLRLSMNGVVSQSMREKGLNYKLNFGVELPRIKSIAAAYEKNHDLAQALWKEDIRECKILAGILQPVDTFFPEIADIWVENMPNIEIAEFTVCSCQVFPLDSFGRGVCTGLWLPYHCPFIGEEGRYGRTSGRRVSRPGYLCSAIRHLSCT